MLQVSTIRIEGFRGFPKVQSLKFDRPVVIFFGENHQGKSSILNAIEWCLFGDACVGVGTGMRERIGWEILNRNSAAASVEMQLDGPAGAYTVLRSQTRAGGKKGKTLRLTRPDGTIVAGEPAEEELRRLIALTFRDFFTTVYQHQEAVRAVLVQEPRDRNDAIDRLLGLSDYRNLLEGFRKAKIVEAQREMGDAVANLQKQVEASLKARAMDLRERKDEAAARGFGESDLTSSRALAVSGTIISDIENLAGILSLPKPSIAPPSHWESLKEFGQEVSRTLDGMWGQTPEVKEQANLISLRARIASAKVLCEEAEKGLRDAEKRMREFMRDRGSPRELEERLAKAAENIAEIDGEIRKASPRAELVEEGIRLLEQSGVTSGVQSCPLCGSRVENLLAHLQEEWSKRIEEQIQALKQRREEEDRRRQLVEQYLRDLEDLRNKLEAATRARGEAVTMLGQAVGHALGEADDPLAIGTQNIDSIDSQLESLEVVLRSRQEEATRIRDRVGGLVAVYEVLSVEEKRRTLERFAESEEFRKLEALRDRAARIIEDVEALRNAVLVAAREEGRAKITSAQEFVDALFRSIAANPAVARLQILVDEKVTGNDYRITNDSGDELGPILSQGDLNCLALALFLGLGEAAGATHPFRVILLDDPSQSLSTEHKRRLVDALNLIADKKAILISTMDREFEELLEKGMTKLKTVYTFRNWQPDRGPEISTGKLT